MSLADRVFCFTEADHYFPLATCTALPRHSSIHLFCGNQILVRGFRGLSSVLKNGGYNMRSLRGELLTQGLCRSLGTLKPLVMEIV